MTNNWKDSCDFFNVDVANNPSITVNDIKIKKDNWLSILTFEYSNEINRSIVINPITNALFVIDLGNLE